MGEEVTIPQDELPPESPFRRENLGPAIFGVCYVKYARARKKQVESDQKAVFRRSPNPRGFEVDEEDMEFTRGALKNIVFGSIATSLGAMTSYAGYKRFIRPGPTLWLGRVGLVGSIAGAAAATMGSLASEVLRLESEPIKVSDRECPAFKAFHECTESAACVEFASKHVAFQRLLDGFAICKERAIKKQGKEKHRDKL